MMCQCRFLSDDNEPLLCVNAPVGTGSTWEASALSAELPGNLKLF